MTAAALGTPPEETPAGSLWAEGYVKTAISNGWLAGAIEGFDYGGTVSYQEARDILARALGAEALSDLKLSQGARVEVASQPLSRKQAAVIFSNLLSFLTGSENP